MNNLTCEHAVFDLEQRAQHILDSQVRRCRFHLVGRCRRNDCQGVAFCAMRGDQGPGFGIDQARDLLFEEVLAEFDVAVLFNALQKLARDGHHR